MNARKFAIALGALLLSLGLAGSAQAAQVLQITYDLSDTTLEYDSASSLGSNPKPVVGEMVVTYESAGTAISAGPAKISAFTMTYTATGAGTAVFYAKLLSPVTGNATAGATGPLTGFPSWSMSMRGSFHCQLPTATCQGAGFTQSVVAGPYSTTTAASATQFAGIYGGTNSTGTAATNTELHTLSGTLQGFTAKVFGGPIGFNATKINVVGREVSRQIIPEPGSLLLLGSGLAGLAALGGTGGLVSQRLRRRPREDA